MGDPEIKRLCRYIDELVTQTQPQLPLRTRLSTATLSARSVSAALDELLPGTLPDVPLRRYVGVMRWDCRYGNRDMDCFFELAVKDRQSERWVWHAMGAYELWLSGEWRDRSTQDMLQSVFVHEMPAQLLARGKQRNHVPVMDAVWVPPSQLADWKPQPGRAALAIADTYSAAGPISSIAHTVNLRNTGQPLATRIKTTGANWRAVNQPDAIPFTSFQTHALLDLPAGTYDLTVYQKTRTVTLGSGQTVVLNIHNDLLFNGTSTSFEDQAWWQDHLAKRSRHAFLADVPERSKWPVMPWFTQP